MSRIVFTLDTISLNQAIRAVDKYKQNMLRKCALFTSRLGAEGKMVANAVMSGHVFSGETIDSLKFEDLGGGHGQLVTASKAILFFEFGAGIGGVGHPLAGEMGMGAGTYPGKGHWNDPNGWWYRGDDGNWHHTYGNAPHMPMYKASRAMIAAIERIGREVFLT